MASTASTTTRTPRAARWSAADLRPQHALAGLPSYHRCVLSPDERLAAFAVQPLTYGTPGNSRLGALVLPTGAPARLAGAEIHVADLPSLEQPVHAQGAAPPPSRTLTHAWGTSWGPCWSPDGSRLAFFSDRNGVPQVWLWHRETGATRLACEEAATLRFGYEGMRWLPDGRRLVAKLRSADWDLVALSARFEQSSRPDGLVTASGGRDVWISPPPAGRESGEEGLRWFDLARETRHRRRDGSRAAHRHGRCPGPAGGLSGRPARGRGLQSQRLREPWRTPRPQRGAGGRAPLPHRRLG